MVDPKVEIQSGETAEEAARRDFTEELGVPLAGALATLGTVKPLADKIIYGFSWCDDDAISSLRSAMGRALQAAASPIPLSKPSWRPAVFTAAYAPSTYCVGGHL
ncbi:NUDIX domain-containing protein [Methylopila sp. Yamaguchi]|uniref:NUDIX domain-containing protein n=1 Tax=Methylopila sp. Yamaguchi TaxID=1437817 RepID=UPI000CB0F246|nr:hypothetical protein METY_0364 [Methylopila sp. Yamaguchi]